MKVLDYNFIVNNVNSYPPGGLSAIFDKFLIDNNLIQNRTVADVGAGCFTLGVIAAKNGAEVIVGTDISKAAMNCAKDNLALNKVKQKTHLFQGKELAPLFPSFKGKIDVLLSGAPWDHISSDEFIALPEERKELSRSFYDINDELMTDIMLRGFDLLTPEGRIFITSSKRTIGRIQQLAAKHNVEYKIVKEEDRHKDGNIHYILELTRNVG